MIFTRPAQRKVEPPPSGIIRDGLMLRWPLDEGTGLTANDDSGNNHHGTLNNMGEGNWVAGYDGSAIYFTSATDEFIVNTSIDVNGFTALSVCLRFKNSVPQAGNQYYINMPYGAGNGVSVYVGASVLRALVHVPDGLKIVNYAAVPQDDVWHSTILTYDGAQLLYYHDGTEVDDEPVTGGIRHDPAQGIVSGAFRTSSFSSSVKDQAVDDVRVYDRALTPAECAQIAAGTG